ncbi:cactincactin-like [Octopus vulgaris]|uniref:Splicing factor Cactin n=1 Tax=Octopus vulgaris TaxID=6645 RepID=A0AA36ARV0_OCTVU|nr:cactincactin-like [Octopus vulgaris]
MDGTLQVKKHHHKSTSKSSHRHKSKKKYKSQTSSDMSDSSESQYRHKKMKKSKHKKKRTHSSSESSSDSNAEPTLEQRLNDFDARKIASIEEYQAEKRKLKELQKATETPEEKRARRLSKKEAKERKRKERMGWDQDYLGYTNADNPFGDEHLLDTFVWQRKMEKEGKKGVAVEKLQKMQKEKMAENRRELEKVKKRRLEREKEQEEREKERERLQREKEAEYFREWEKQEDSFHLHQAKMRSKIRIQDARAKPIDLLAKYISAEDDDLAIEMHEPYTYLYGLTVPDLEDLLEDIKVYLQLEQGKNADYWRDIITVTEDEVNKLKKLDPLSRDYAGDRREGINHSVSSEVSTIFKGKTTNQLLLLQEQMKKKLQGGEGIDIGYWESLMSQLNAHIARTRLRERHQDVLRQKLFKLKQEQGIESAPLFPIMVESEGPQRVPANNNVPQPSSSSADGGSESVTTQNKVDSSVTAPANTSEGEEMQDGATSEPVFTEQDLVNQCQDDYENGGYSPKLLRLDELEFDAIVFDPADDMKKLELAREQVLTTGRVKLDMETEFEKKAREGMGDDEAQFSVEVALDQQAFLWSNKYRPRKPRFFNRVHTGFEWNKYNQTHYDIDNPPPKIVQGYKFNIFYPDLINKADTPEYALTPCNDNKDFALLRFHAGPPYEDIAFKIVNREWEYSYKRGFRCQFQNNIFQLWFHFKRYRYRR